MNARILPWVCLLAVLAAGSAQAEERVWVCPDTGTAKAAFTDGSARDWPNYSDGAGARVQRQHPDTAFIGAQAKFIDWGDRTGAICQYYSHIGYVFTMVAMDLGRQQDTGTCEPGVSSETPCWRLEYTESFEKDDQPGKEQMNVCMEVIDGESFPSPGCPFTLPQ
ncbi:MAG: hypothetical protein RLO80_04505 [Hyphomonas sp.]